MKKEPVVIVFSILAVLGVISAGLALIDSIDKDTAAIFALIVSALTAGASFFVRAMVTPWEDVVSKIQDGHIVPGPASAARGSTSLTNPGAAPPADPYNPATGTGTGV